MDPGTTNINTCWTPAVNQIPSLYALGELGSLFGLIYLFGGNLVEGFVGGRIAGRRAALGADAD